ncbi:hypothetical protein COEREDRAFT_12444 [Coemansia reversa NRRL 1564]|uniref:Uncharacterized protein n=1 Tax=Coemansia reversa (strain ATCC 12441 / NRRL 1564) TaxID=763665 RepID=A0A2G5B0V7_COERN|nr:hypothetical protein COEREDRAFT_12444 [Coemansia reversa NRRL 1564]|eukprot:PIA12651.1 hypothetical protein COEREDRAFT_12444 [Coemansia reversa NRRL 1564]
MSYSAPDSSSPNTVQFPETAQSSKVAQSTEMTDLLNRSAGEYRADYEDIIINFNQIFERSVDNGRAASICGLVGLDAYCV